MINYQKLKHISKLETKTLWTIAAVIVLVNMGIGVTMGVISSHKHKKELSERYTKLTQSRAQILVEPIWTFEFERAQFLLNELITDNNILEAKIHVDKEIISSSQNTANSTPSEVITAPIVYKSTFMNEPLGKLAMTVSTREADSILTKKITESLIISILLLLVLSFGISRISGNQMKTG